jgi:hypothetical protein
MIKRLERLQDTVNKYMADLQPGRLMPYQSEWKLVASRRPNVLTTLPRLLQENGRREKLWKQN